MQNYVIIRLKALIIYIFETFNIHHGTIFVESDMLIIILITHLLKSNHGLYMYGFEMKIKNTLVHN